jgi:hypothetical protein
MYMSIPGITARIGIRDNIHTVKEISLGFTTEISKLAFSGLTSYFGSPFILA